MQAVLTVSLLSDAHQRLGRSIDIFCVQLGANKLDIIVESDDLAASAGLDILLVDIARLVVEEPVGVSAPGDTSHVDSSI